MSLFNYFSKTSKSIKNTQEKSDDSCTYVPSITESGLGQQEYQNVLSNVVDLTTPSPAQPDSSKKQRAKRKPYTHFTDEERAKIAKYAAENGNSNAIKHFEKDFPGLNESTVRNFKKKYYSQLSDGRRKGESTVTAIPSKVRGRPSVLMELDEKLIRFIKGIRGRGGVINIHVVRAVTQALIASNPSMVYLSNFDMPRSWVHSIYKRMGLKIRAGTTSRPPVPYDLYAESRYSFLSSIAETIEQFSIPPELVFNVDQTPCSYVSVGKMTMAKKGEKNVAIKGLSDKRNITLTFTITLAGSFLPMQIIY